MIDNRISILIVDTAIDFGGSIVSTANLIRGLDRSRFTITFVTATSEELVRSRLLEAADITQVVVSKKLFHYGVIGRLTNVLKLVRMKFLRRSLIYCLYPLRLVANFPYALKMAWLIRKHRVDIVQLNNAFGNDELELVALIMGRPRIVFFRGYVSLSAIERRFFLPGTKSFVSVSGFVKEQAVADGVPTDKICVATPPAITESIDENLRNAVRERYNLKPGQPIFGIFGRIVSWKGQKEFIEAVRIVVRSVPDVKVFIVGDTSDGDARYFTELREMVAEYGLEDRVVFTGYIERVFELYSIMDVVVHASIEPEPSGRVIFEAMSYRVPVIASCFGGPKEFIEDGVDGFIVDPREPHEIAQKICLLILDPELRVSMGERAEEKVARIYNKSAYAAQVERVYLDAIGPGV